ncbi:TAP_C-terminal (TAP-C) domain [Hexamita inflata]|uniref:TAP C-terminal (TAP-C) domain n=1 Tax=Hexamita inflata TaxID=28002 RepID=A0AA86PW38_9EUKA|nr:TAP C-terminal (TAP-C) domain [Hexamita inflata]
MQEEGLIQQFMNATNSTRHMASSYLHFYYNNLEKAIQEFFKDDMTAKIEQFMYSTRTSKEDTEKYLAAHYVINKHTITTNFPQIDQTQTSQPFSSVQSTFNALNQQPNNLFAQNANPVVNQFGQNQSVQQPAQQQTQPNQFEFKPEQTPAHEFKPQTGVNLGQPAKPGQIAQIIKAKENNPQGNNQNQFNPNQFAQGNTFNPTKFENPTQAPNSQPTPQVNQFNPQGNGQQFNQKQFQGNTFASARSILSSDAMQQQPVIQETVKVKSFFNGANNNIQDSINKFLESGEEPRGNPKEQVRSAKEMYNQNQNNYNQQNSLNNFEYVEDTNDYFNGNNNQSQKHLPKQQSAQKENKQVKNFFTGANNQVKFQETMNVSFEIANRYINAAGGDYDKAVNQYLEDQTIMNVQTQKNKTKSKQKTKQPQQNNDDNEQATRFLKQNNYNFEAAMDAFYESGEQPENAVPIEKPQPPEFAIKQMMGSTSTSREQAIHYLQNSFNSVQEAINKFIDSGDEPRGQIDKEPEKPAKDIYNQNQNYSENNYNQQNNYNNFDNVEDDNDYNTNQSQKSKSKQPVQKENKQVKSFFTGANNQVRFQETMNVSFDIATKYINAAGGDYDKAVQQYQEDQTKTNVQSLKKNQKPKQKAQQQQQNNDDNDSIFKPVSKSKKQRHQQNSNGYNQNVQYEQNQQFNYQAYPQQDQMQYYPNIGPNQHYNAYPYDNQYQNIDQNMQNGQPKTSQNIEKFIEVTSSSHDQAVNFLNQNNQNVQQAINAFFESVEPQNEIVNPLMNNQPQFEPNLGAQNQRPQFYPNGFNNQFQSQPGMPPMLQPAQLAQPVQFAPFQHANFDDQNQFQLFNGQYPFINQAQHQQFVHQPTFQQAISHQDRQQDDQANITNNQKEKEPEVQQIIQVIPKPNEKEKEPDPVPRQTTPKKIFVPVKPLTPQNEIQFTQKEKQILKFIDTYSVKFQKEMKTDQETAQKYLEDANYDYSRAVEQFQEDQKSNQDYNNEKVFEPIQYVQTTKKKKKSKQKQSQNQYQNQLHQSINNQQQQNYGNCQYYTNNTVQQLQQQQYMAQPYNNQNGNIQLNNIPRNQYTPQQFANQHNFAQNQHPQFAQPSYAPQQQQQSFNSHQDNMYY